MNDVTVIIPIYGDIDYWTPLAVRAQHSAWHQSVEPTAVVISVADTLAEARNKAAAIARTDAPKPQSKRIHCAGSTKWFR